MSCPDFPLCLGQVVPPLVNVQITAHFSHRVLAILGEGGRRAGVDPFGEHPANAVLQDARRVADRVDGLRLPRHAVTATLAGRKCEQQGDQAHITNIHVTFLVSSSGDAAILDGGSCFVPAIWDERPGAGTNPGGAGLV